jgi:NAD(P)-dependent dehydrogenase (short-subunit alcohol dehydrogenase family)
MTLHGKRVVVLGGTAGIGLATARAAADEGAEVVVASSRQSTVDKALTELPSGATGFALDLRAESAIAGFFAELGEFDHLVYTAGGLLQVGALAETEMTAARDFFEVRYWGAMAAVKYATPYLRSGGSITLTSGGTSQRPQSGWTTPTAVCGATEALTRALAVELAPLRVNAVRPGLVRTDLWRNLSETDRAVLYEQVERTLPVGRVGEPADIARGYLYLMTQEYGTGVVLTLDGGHLLV